MAFGQNARECCLNCSKIASSHGQADIHPVGMKSFESTQASPGCEDPFVFKEGRQKILVIACERDHRAWPVATRKSFHHAHGAKTAIHVIAQENRHDMVERLTFHIGLDALGHLTEQIVTTMNITYTVHPRPIWDTTRGRNRGRRFPTRLNKRIYPPDEFRGPQLLGQAVSLNRVVSYAHHKQRIRISWAGAFARPDFERPVMRPDKWR